MRLVARISSDQVSSKTDVTTSSYEGFKFCIDVHVNAYISVDARIQLARNTNLHETNLHEYSVGETRIYTKRIEPLCSKHEITRNVQKHLKHDSTRHDLHNSKHDSTRNASNCKLRNTIYTTRLRNIPALLWHS